MAIHERALSMPPLRVPLPFRPGQAPLTLRGHKGLHGPQEKESASLRFQVSRQVSRAFRQKQKTDSSCTPGGDRLK